MEFFNFGQNFIRYIKTLYNNISSVIINNGHLSEYFFPKRGVRQGCPLSPYLFIIAVELLALSIRQNEQIEGIKIDNDILKLSQLADDTLCYIKNIKSLSLLMDTFKNFEEILGLKVNLNKTYATYIGNPKPNFKLLKNIGIIWKDKPIETLGIVITGTEEDHYKNNFEPCIKKMKTQLNNWKKRFLSLKGKIQIINTLAISKLMYLCSVIKPPKRVFSEIKEMVLDFIWEGKRSKIAYSTLIQPINNGGLGLIDVENKCKGLNMNWIKRFCTQEGSWQAIPRMILKKLKLKNFVELFSFNINYKKEINNKYAFFKQICEDLSSIKNFKDDVLTILNQNILSQLSL